MYFVRGQSKIPSLLAIFFPFTPSHSHPRPRGRPSISRLLRVSYVTPVPPNIGQSAVRAGQATPPPRAAFEAETADARAERGVVRYRRRNVDAEIRALPVERLGVGGSALFCLGLGEERGGEGRGVDVAVCREGGEFWEAVAAF